MATAKAHHSLPVRTSPAATTATAPAPVDIATTLDGYTLKGFPTAASIKRIADNTLKQVRTAFFHNVLVHPIARSGIYNYVLRSDVLARLQTEAPSLAAAINQAERTTIFTQTLPPRMAPTPANACLMPGAMLPDNTLADAAAALHQRGLITIQGPASTLNAPILVNTGHVSFAGLNFLRGWPR